MGDEVVKICAAAILCAVVSLVCRGMSGHLSAAVRIGGAVVIFSMALFMISGVLESAQLIVSRFDGYSEITDYWGIMIRALGIALLCRICSDVCRDCGESTVAGGVEIAGKITILAMSLPIVEDILTNAEQLFSMI